MIKPVSKFRKSQLELNARYLVQGSPEPKQVKGSKMPLALRNSIEVVRYISR